MPGSPLNSNHKTTINETILVLRHYQHPLSLKARLWSFGQGTKHICKEYHRGKLLIFSYRFPSYCLDRKYTRWVSALHLFFFPLTFSRKVYKSLKHLLVSKCFHRRLLHFTGVFLVILCVGAFFFVCVCHIMIYINLSLLQGSPRVYGNTDREDVF